MDYLGNLRATVRGRRFGIGAIVVYQPKPGADPRPYTRDALAGGCTLPPGIAVAGLPAHPTREPCCADHPDARWVTSEYHAYGLGTLILTGCRRPDGSLSLVGPGYAVPDPEAIADIAALRCPAPRLLAAADPATRVGFLVRRLARLIPAAVVQWAKLTPAFSAAADPLLAAELAGWRFDGARVVGRDDLRFLLSDPLTY